MHSCTKYMGGHSDIMAGCVVFKNAQHHRSVYLYRIEFTAPLDPMSCYNLLRSLRTLHVRMERHNENALAVARYLENQAKVKRVLYPGLESHPDHKLAKSIMKVGQQQSFHANTAPKCYMCLLAACRLENTVRQALYDIVIWTS